MNSLDEARNICAINLYKWAKTGLDLEIQNDFALIRKFAEAGARDYLAIMDSLSIDEKRASALILLRYTHSDASNALGERLTPPEHRLIEGYNEKVRDVMAQERRERDWARPTLRKRQIRSLLSEHIGERLGKVVRCRCD